MGDRHFHFEAGSQYVEHIETQNFTFNIDKVESMSVGRTSVGEKEDPHAKTGRVYVDVLSTPEAQQILTLAKENGWIDDNMQPLISQNKAAILASVIADELGLTPRWAPFEKLWGIPDLANKLSHAQMCNYYSDSLKAFEDSLV